MVTSEEQVIGLSDNHSAEIKFDYIYKRWYYNLYINDTLLYAGIPLTKDCPTLKGIASVYLMIAEDNENKVDYEPFAELGTILKLAEVIE